MLSPKELKGIERKKRTLVARNDRLRQECGEIWSVAGRHVELAEEGVRGLRWLPPVLSLLSAGAMVYLKSRSFRGSQCIAPLLSVASLAMSRPGRRARRQLPPGRREP